MKILHILLTSLLRIFSCHISHSFPLTFMTFDTSFERDNFMRYFGEYLFQKAQLLLEYEASREYARRKEFLQRQHYNVRLG